MYIDKYQLERASIAAIQRRREYDALRGPHVSGGRHRLVNQPAIGQLLRSHLAQGGLDVDELDRRLARTQSELHEQFQQQKKDAAAYLASDETAFRAGVHRKLRDFGHFPASVIPLTVTPILLDKPFLILELPKPELDIFRDSHLEPGNSWVKIRIDKTGEGAHFTYFNFYYMWTNESEFAAVVNVDTMLRLTGFFEAIAEASFFGGGYADVRMGARLDLLEWWNQTPDGPTQPLDQDSQKRWFAELQAWGPDLFPFRFPTILYGMFPGFIVNLSYSNWIIPSQSTAIIVVNFGIDYTIVGDLSSVIVGLSSDEFGYSVISPWVELTLLTRPGAGAQLEQ